MQRIWSKFEIKSSRDGERILEGVATSPTLDSSADIVEPRGAVFSLPLPVLAAHDSTKPLGEVIAADVTARGINVRIRLAQVEAPPSLKERLDVAWAEIKAGLCRGLSIGFSPIEYEPIQGGYGIRYLSWKWRELSLVVVPANEDASITAIRSADRAACALRSALPSSGSRLAAALADPAVTRARAARLSHGRRAVRPDPAYQLFGLD